MEQSLGGSFRAYLPDLNTDRFTLMKKHDCYTYGSEFKKGKGPPWLFELYNHWCSLLDEPFKGVTSDGRVLPNLFCLEDDDIPIDRIVHAANQVILHTNQRQKARLFYHIDSPEWRTWSNPEFLLSDKGIRLDDSDVHSGLRESILAVLEASLSSEGYQKALAAMRINDFLGQLVEAPKIMNKYSYNFVLFGRRPSTTDPWGLSFYGHHLCLNAFFNKRQMVLSPWFTGAEPNLIDTGSFEGTRLFHVEEALGLRLIQSLSDKMRARAQIYKLMRDPSMPPGRWNHDDQRHLCGAYRDNRIVPYEGVLVSSLNTQQQDLVTSIVTRYLIYLPEKARAREVAKIQAFYYETYFSWIGGYGDHDAFYYRVQSPVIILEFDHHSGVFLKNKEPAKFHIHTLLRTPNGGDYGMALRSLIQGKEQDFCWKDSLQ